MKKKQFKVTYAGSVTTRQSANTGNNYTMQDVVLVANGEPLTNPDGSQNYPTAIATTAFNLEQPLKVGDSLTCDVRFSVGRGNSGRYYTKVDISNVNVDKLI